MVAGRRLRHGGPMTTKMKRRGVAATAVLALALGTGSAEASVTSGQRAELQRQVDHVLRHAAPGGRQISPNRVAWARDGVTLTLAVPGRARAAGLRDCERGELCLWEDFEAAGRRVAFVRYGTYRLRAYGMPRFDPRGASSWFNNQTDGAKAVLHADFDFSMRGHGNLYGKLNDRGKSVTLSP
jgi:hypothetical protein